MAKQGQQGQQGQQGEWLSEDSLCAYIGSVSKSQSQLLTSLLPEKLEAEKFNWSAWVPTMNKGQARLNS